MRPPSNNVAELIHQRFDPTDRSTYLDPARAFLEARYGSSSQFAGDQQPETSADEPEPEPSGTITYPHPGGDLDGDGLEDVLVEEFDQSDDSLSLQAVRGSDGKELWRVEIAGAEDGLGYSVGDLNADGKDDILVQALDFLEVTQSGDCTETGCWYDYTDRVRMVVGIRSGATGQKLWTKQYEGTFNYHSEEHYSSDTTTASYTAEDRLRTTNLFFFPLVSGDHDEDAKPDIVLDAIDHDFDVTYGWEQTGVSSEEIWLTGTEDLDIVDRFATRASLLSGDDGQKLGILAAPRGPSVSVLEPGQDVTGDAAPELLWSTWTVPDFHFSCERMILNECQASEETSSFTLETLDGTSLEPVWNVAVDGIWDAIPMLIDFDPSNDGVDDIVIWSWPADSEESVLDAIDGRGGHSLWSRRTVDQMFPLATGEYGGGAGKDLLTVGLRFPPAGSPGEQDADVTILLARLDGSSGQTLFETERPISDLVGSHNWGFTSIYAGGMVDASGDGQEDAFSGSWALGGTMDFETGELEITETKSSYQFESGADGSLLHAANGSTWFEAWPEPDLDGDGSADMSEWHYPLEDDGEIKATLRTVIPSTVLWEQRIPVAEAWDTTFWPSGDQDGVPGAEVLYGLNREQNGRWSSVVASLAGKTGAHRWHRRQ